MSFLNSKFPVIDLTKDHDSEPVVEHVIKVSKAYEPTRILLYRCINNDGEYSKEYAVEYLFNNKDTALKFLRRRRDKYTEVEDNDSLPF